MATNNWWDNIPENGILCKEKSSGAIVRIIGKTNHVDFDMVFDDCVSRHTYDPEELTPLTAAEIWQFMPWYQIETAPPRNSNILGVEKYGGIVACHVYADGTIKEGDYKIQLIKWQPLPLVQS